MRTQVDHRLGGSVTVSAGPVTLFTYVYRPGTPQRESPKPYLHPIRTLSGDLVSLYRPHDHVWHKGIAWSLPHVGEHNFWGGPTYVHGRSYVQLPNNGSALHRCVDTLTGTEFGHTLDWVSEQGDPVITERRTLTWAIAGDVSWILTFTTTMTNVSGATLAFGSPTTKGRENAGYGGLFWRGPRSFTDGLLQSPAGTGGDELRGSRGPWFAFRGRHDGVDRASTVVIVDDTANPHHPPQWFARTEEFACLNPAPFFSAELDLAAGESVTFRYAVVIADGDHGDAGTERLAALGAEALT
ncbi:DUF6807 domain-containing protein [Actinoplanes xinjiangensis]|uniref:Methane monooxygenase PmoA-like n=1 Tax=Actinoplanes xinjiangensis TaxID=512350 RepID=A0A316FF99_9ACTN|nr:PmoA family protein [Actinoplanes xinjiangensis]PWK47494.1 methane monooxygenase PmoA-like [Actinoplanes xinjiangensis]GIF39577.1 hypothetical protein Axi01nite_38880 [Actinoplanes xinjiangensis]